LTEQTGGWLVVSPLHGKISLQWNIID